MTARDGRTGPVTPVQGLVLVLVGAPAVTAVLTGVLVATGLVGAVPRARLRSVGVVLDPWLVVALVLLVHLTFLGAVAVLFTEEIRTKVRQAGRQWSTLPAAVKSALVGFPFTFVAVLAVVATHTLAASLPTPVRLAVPVVTWLAVAAVAFDHLGSADRLAGLHRRLWTGVGVGAGVTATAILLDRFVDSVDAPGYAPLVVLLVAAGLASALLVHSDRREGDGYLSALLVRSGFAQVRRIQTMTVALSLGLLVGVLGALLVSEAVGGILPTLLAFLVVWAVATLVGFQWFRRTDVAHSGLVITDVRERSSGRRELAVANERDERVDLRNAKIRDTEQDLYRTNVDVLLSPGGTETFDIPPEFSLVPATDEFATDLPLGLAVSKSEESPVVVTRDGRTFELGWADEVTDDVGSPSGQPEVRSADGRDDDA